jgi:tetratricopeptide (TPR) repeat protein
MNIIFKWLIMALPLTATTQHTIAQTNSEKPLIIMGVCNQDSLQKKPFNTWFNPAFDQYSPDKKITEQLLKEKMDNIQIRVFFGSWCGDSKRELPRFMKLLQSISFPEKKVELVGLGGSDSLYKQSPGHEEADLGIFRVPVFIIYRDGKEINRINEFPVVSLERDLLDIILNKSYQPNYQSHGLIKQWLQEGTLTDDNTSIRGLAEQLRHRLCGEHELNSLGYLLLKQEKKTAALQVFRMNYLLYPESANTASSLGEAYLETGNNARAKDFLEKSLELNKDPQAIKPVLELLYKMKEKEWANGQRKGVN